MKLPIEMQNKTANTRTPDGVDVEYLPRGWEKHMEGLSDAASDVRTAINKYADAHRLVSRMDIPKAVRRLTKRGIDTARIREDNWSGIQDDPFVMNLEFTKAVKDGWMPRHIARDTD